MENNQNQNQASISLIDMWNIFLDHVILIVAAAIITFASITVYSFATYKPEYKSTAMLYILRQSSSEQIGATTAQNADFSLALSTINDCRILLTSDTVLEQVIDELGMSISTKALRSMIRVDNPTQSRILEVTVTAPTPMDAKLIVEKLCAVGAMCIMETMGIDQINPVDKDESGNYLGTYSETPSNSRFTPYSFIGAILVAAIIYGIYLVLFVLDDKVNTPDDVEKYTGLITLGIIPNIEDSSSRSSNNPAAYQGKKPRVYSEN